jgi:hypothetical protein
MDFHMYKFLLNHSVLSHSSVLIIILLLSISSYGQTPAWASRYNGLANKQDGGRTMVVHGDYVYVTGPSEGRKGDIDYLTIKYSKNTGQQIWVARYNGPAGNTDQPYGIAVDANENVYVTGGSMTTATNYDYATVKYRPDGSQEWAQRFGTPRNDMARDVKVDLAGNIYVTGFADAANTINGNAIITLKYTSTGLRSLVDTYNGLPDLYDGSAINREEGVSLALDNNGNIYVGGVSRKMFAIKYSLNEQGGYSRGWPSPGLGDIDYGTGRKIIITSDNHVVITGFGAETIKFNSTDGSVIWKNVYLPDSPLSPSFSDMTQDENGNIYVAGNIRNVATNDDYLTVKYSSGGDQQWVQTYNGSSNASDMCRSIAYSSSLDGGFICITGNLIMKVSSRTNVTNIGTVKYKAVDGTQQAVFLYDGPENQGSTGFEIVSDNTGGIYITGESTYKQTGTDIITVKYQGNTANSIVISNSELNQPVFSSPVLINAYPNPVRQASVVDFTIPLDGHVRLSVVDELGREVKLLCNAKTSAGRHTITFNRNGLASGGYIYRLQYNNTIHVKHFVLSR